MKSFSLNAVAVFGNTRSVACPKVVRPILSSNQLPSGSSAYGALFERNDSQANAFPVASGGAQSSTRTDQGTGPSFNRYASALKAELGHLSLMSGEKAISVTSFCFIGSVLRFRPPPIRRSPRSSRLQCRLFHLHSISAQLWPRPPERRRRSRPRFPTHTRPSARPIHGPISEWLSDTSPRGYRPEAAKSARECGCWRAPLG